MFNLQSGQHRQRFPARLSPKQAETLKAHRANVNTDTSVMQARESTYQPGEGKHQGAISGLIVDSINRKVISSGLDGKLKVITLIIVCLRKMKINAISSFGSFQLADC